MTTIGADATYENGVLKLKTPVDLPERSEVHVTIEPIEGEARTSLGRKLRALRAEIADSETSPLDWEGISDEVAARRGGWRESS